VLANFSLAGLPLLASFPADIALWSSLAEISLPIALLSLVGNAGLLVAGLRTLAVLIIPTEEHRWHISEKFDQAFWLTAGLAVLLIMGLLPSWYFPALLRLGTLALPNAP
jgi:NADH:ubiquinone oxidoreductase subunit 2 (subunit N)